MMEIILGQENTIEVLIEITGTKKIPDLVRMILSCEEISYVFDGKHKDSDGGKEYIFTVDGTALNQQPGEASCAIEVLVGERLFNPLTTEVSLVEEAKIVAAIVSLQGKRGNIGATIKTSSKVIEQSEKPVAPVASPPISQQEFMSWLQEKLSPYQELQENTVFVKCCTDLGPTKMPDIERLIAERSMVATGMIPAISLSEEDLLSRFTRTAKRPEMSPPGEAS